MPAGSFLAERRPLVIACAFSLLFLLLLTGWLRHDAGTFVHVSGLNTDDGLTAVLGKQRASEEDGFTLVVPAYTRPQALPEFLENYANGNISSLRRIVVLLWTDLEHKETPSFANTLDTYQTPIVIEQRNVVGLNERFRRSKHIETNCVLAVDDDFILEPEDVEFGYQRWKEHDLGRKRMAGFIARTVRSSKKQDLIYDAPREDYSMVLTKAAFYHVDWMNAYWSADARMTSLRAYVDEHLNCEDVLMAYLHAYHTRIPPLYVEPISKTDIGKKNGISKAKGHIKAREACIRHFNEAFGAETLVTSDVVVQRVKTVDHLKNPTSHRGGRYGLGQ